MAGRPLARSSRMTQTQDSFSVTQGLWFWRPGESMTCGLSEIRGFLGCCSGWGWRSSFLNKFEQHTRILGKEFLFYKLLDVFQWTGCWLTCLGSWHYRDFWEALGKKEEASCLDRSGGVSLLVQILGGPGVLHLDLVLEPRLTGSWAEIFASFLSLINITVTHNLGI